MPSSPAPTWSSASVPARPVGVARLLGWIADVAPEPARPLHLVVNRAPADRFRRAELAHEIARTFAPASLLFVPTTGRSTRRVGRRGSSRAARSPPRRDAGRFRVPPAPVARRAPRRRLARRRAIALTAAPEVGA